jgi:hypothetical protein
VRVRPYLLQGRHADPLGAGGGLGKREPCSSLIGQAASCGQRHREFMLGASEPRPSVQPLLIHAERGFEMLLGLGPFANEDRTVTVRQQLLVEPLGLDRVAESGADLGQAP